MDLMHNISLERQKFYATHDFNKYQEPKDVEVVYTWNMDFNRSILSSATILVPKTTATPSSNTMPTWAHNSWVCLFTAMLAVAIGGNVIVIWIVTVKAIFAFGPY
ncbi:hypothetical protein PYW08_001464 [Mythimna loreyi]|uniref:Uncharacterized protein n=1 Tax=Mythimna loreyi TaxID=667449 RepID=A0ACC2R9D7_9NEOP|nr:hypothetical protein PYW08_001464 [Mythimna loreyi]